MGSDTISIILGAVGFLLGLSTQWGAQRATIKKLEEEIQRLDKSIDALQSAISSLHREYVSHRHFDSVTAELKDTVRGMEKDIKEILKHLQK